MYSLICLIKLFGQAVRFNFHFWSSGTCLLSPCIFTYTCRVRTGQQTPRRLSPVASGVSGLSRAQLPLQKKLVLPLGNTKTGHSSITITLIKRETKAQHTSSSRIGRGLNQSLSDAPQLLLLDSISKRQTSTKTGVLSR